MTDDEVVAGRKYRFNDLCTKHTEPEWTEVTVTGPSEWGEFPWRIVNKVGVKGVAKTAELSEL
jgi:hypothetical protein